LSPVIKVFLFCVDIVGVACCHPATGRKPRFSGWNGQQSAISVQLKMMLFVLFFCWRLKADRWGLSSGNGSFRMKTNSSGGLAKNGPDWRLF
jgi:hypothetical protein